VRLDVPTLGATRRRPLGRVEAAREGLGGVDGSDTEP